MTKTAYSTLKRAPQEHLENKALLSHFESLSPDEQASLNHLCFKPLAANLKNFGQASFLELAYKLGQMLNHKDPNNVIGAHFKALEDLYYD